MFPKLLIESAIFAEEDDAGVSVVTGVKGACDDVLELGALWCILFNI